MRKTATEAELKKAELAHLENFLEIPLDRIVEWIRGQRETSEEHVEALAVSMKEVGQQDPILVSDRQDGTFRGVDGGHRAAAAKLLHWTHIRAQILPPEDEADLLVNRFHANKFRLDLDPVQESLEAKAVLEAEQARDPKVKQGDIARRLGLDPSTLSQLLDLADLPGPVKALLQSGELSKAHGAWVHKALIHPAKGVPPEDWTQKVVNLATDAASKGIDVRTAVATVDDVRKRLELEAEAAERARKDAADLEARAKRADVLRKKFDVALKKAKAKTCPGPYEYWEPGDPPDKKCGQYPAFFDDLLLEKEDRAVGICREGDEGRTGHRWDVRTGELIATPAERKQLADQARARMRQAEAAAKAARAERDAEKETARADKAAGAAARKSGKTDRDYASFFSRTDYAKLVQIVADVEKEASLEVRVEDGQEITAFAEKAQLGLPDLVISNVELPDGKGGGFRCRVSFSGFGSGKPAWAGPGNYAGRGDDVAEDAGALRLRKIRSAWLRYVAKNGGAKQREDDLWPTQVQSFRLGELVALGPKAEPKGYRGQKGRILAFDLEWERLKHGGYWDDRHPTIRIRADAKVYAVLDIAQARKAHPISDLVRLPTKDAKKGGRPRKMRSPSRDGGPPGILGEAKKGKAKAPKGRGK